jgi:hypothetical protein
MAFLETFCGARTDGGRPACIATAFFLHPTEPLIASAWLADEPFHIRHGFVNASDEPLGSDFPPDYELQVFVTRIQGPPLGDGSFEIGQSYRFTPDYLVRESSDHCGPGYLDQTESLPCDEFVHEFNQGLPPGSYNIWVAWQAPCSAWTIARVCEDDDPFPLFAASALGQPFYHDDWTPADSYADRLDPDFLGDNSWPYDPWRSGGGTDQ